MIHDVKVTVIGAGVVGLAIAAKLSENFKSIFVIEKHLKFGQEISCRNSEVVHSGIYYPKDSLKTKLCIEGRKMLYEFCEQYGIKYNKCGKLIVANSNLEDKKLDVLLRNAKDNGVYEVKKLLKEEVEFLEPNVRALTAIYSSETGIVDSHGLMKQLELNAINNEVQFIYGSEVVKIQKIDNGYKLSLTEHGGDSFDFSSEIVINASGLNSDKISEMLGIINPDYKLHFWKGEYFSIGNGKNKLINRLIYPVPNENIIGLGVHATIDLGEGLKLGPNTIYLKDKKINYDVDPEHKTDFFKSAKQYFPFLELEDLRPDQAGIRPKLQGIGDHFRDFVIKEEKENGYANFINLIGIESPGLTASLAIADYVKKMICNN